MSETTKELETTDLNKEVAKLTTKLWDRTPFMVDKYRKLLRHTGGVISNSMAVAYQKGLQDAALFILENNKGEK